MLDSVFHQTINHINMMQKEDFIHSLKQTCSAAGITIEMLRNTDDGTVQGDIQFGNTDVLVTFDAEKESPLIADFTILIQQLKGFLSHYNDNNYEIFLHDVSCQVISDIYQQSDMTEQDIKKESSIFKENMSLRCIEVYPDAFMLVYDIKLDNEFLHLQLDMGYSIEDMFIE